MKVLEVSRPLPVRLPHPLFFQHTTVDGRTLTFKCPMPYRLTALNAFWQANDFAIMALCPVCPKDEHSKACGVCHGEGKYQKMSEAESVENTEKVACAVVGSFWADGKFILEAKFNGDMDTFALEVSFEIMSGEHALTWTDLSAIFQKCTTLLIAQLYPKSKADKEVQETVDFLLARTDGGTSSPSTSALLIAEVTPSGSSSSTQNDNGSSSPTIASGPDASLLDKS